jgi:general stress protein YciG
MATVPKEVSQYLSKIGRKGGKIGGKATTKRKADAARANGHKGGRPRKGVK